MSGCAPRSDRAGRAVRAALLALAAFAATFARADVPVPPAERPARVVSMNLCTDQLALLLADPGQIVSLSHFAADPGMSVLADQAAHYRANHGRAEEIALLSPDLVLADVWSSPATISMLRRLGIRVAQLPPGTSLPEIRTRITAMGRLLGQETRAQAMLAQFDADLAAIARPAPGLRGAVYGIGGYGYGPNTLEGQILALAGFDNVVGGPGQDWGGPMPLEQLVMAAPDLVVSGGDSYGHGPSRAGEMLRHPALAALPRARGLRDARWSCGQPAMLGAVAELAAIGKDLEKEKAEQ
jgi:iron complex transport system substrate-binding protein